MTLSISLLPTLSSSLSLIPHLLFPSLSWLPFLLFLFCIISFPIYQRLPCTLSLSRVSLVLHSTLSSVTLSFPFCAPRRPTSSSYHSLSLALSLSHPLRFCIRVPIAVGERESLSGLLERRFRRHDNEPRKPSHSLTPSLVSSASLSSPFYLVPTTSASYSPPHLSATPILFSRPRPRYHHHNQRPPPIYALCLRLAPCKRVFACLSLMYATVAMVRACCPRTRPPLRECKGNVVAVVPAMSWCRCSTRMCGFVAG